MLSSLVLDHFGSEVYQGLKLKVSESAPGGSRGMFGALVLGASIVGMFPFGGVQKSFLRFRVEPESPIPPHTVPKPLPDE